MRVLFFTQEYCMHRRNGAQHYSASLVDALVDIGVEGIMFVLREAAGPLDYRGWQVIYGHPSAQSSVLVDNLSFLPRMVSSAKRAIRTEDVRRIAQTCDLVMIDHLACAGVLSAIGSVPYLYIAHNDETESKRSIVSVLDNWLHYLAHRFDLYKLDYFQKVVERGARALSVISERDYTTVTRRGVPAKNIHLIEPWRQPCERPVGTEFRERIIALVGTFEWTPKRIALWRLVDSFANAVSGAGRFPASVKLRVAGKFHKDDGERLDRYSDIVEVVRDYDSADDVLRDARIGILVDGAGAGFKIKFLDYLDAGCAIYSLRSDVFMSCMIDGRNCRLFDSVDELLSVAAREIDDVELLTRLVDGSRQDFARLFSRSRFAGAVSEMLHHAVSGVGGVVQS